MTNLSPVAQAVLDAANGFNSYSPDDVLNESRWIVAAALRAAANDWRVNTEFIDGVEYIRTTTLEMIVAELEALDD